MESPRTSSLRSSASGHRALRRGRVSLPGQIYLLTTATMDRQPFFACHPAACAAARCFANPALLADAQMLAWVLMPDHVHWLLQLGERHDLHGMAVRLKSASARQVNGVLHRQGALWSAGYHDHALRADEDIIRTARYIVANPLRAGIVHDIGDYPFWNAVWLQ